jgi:hypothetical protein
VDESGKAVFSDRVAKVTVALPTGARSADFTKDGHAVIKGVPRETLGTAQEVRAEIYFFDQLKATQPVVLTSDVMSIVMRHNPAGTPEGLRNKRAANLLLLKLLAPYRVLAAQAKLRFVETTVEQYCEPAFQAAALRADLNAPLSKLKVNLERAFDVLSENEVTAVPRQSDTIGELMQSTAISFKNAVNAFSSADPMALDPAIRRELLRLTQSNFVEIAASGAKRSFPAGRLHEGFMTDICMAMKGVADRNVLNPFSVFYTI